MWILDGYACESNIILTIKKSNFSSDLIYK